MPAIKSRYAEIWDEIKLDDATHKRGVLVAVHHKMHARIIKAVRKRKDLDTGFKFECVDAERGISELKVEVKGEALLFKLKYRISAEEL